MLTEDLNPRAKDIDALTGEEIISLMNEEDTVVVKAVHAALHCIGRAVKNAIETLKSGGSLIYIGAGTSGRLGILDSSEMPPTFNVSPHLIRAVIAGGERAITEAAEGAEDDEEAGKRAVQDITEKDMLLGISASGKTPFVISALKEGKRKGARCWLLTCNKVEHDFLDGAIKALVGPEIIAGSTRLKAGTATKMVLNMISTATMIKLGRVYKGYMVDVTPTNAKLKSRASGIISEITGCSDGEAEEYLEMAKGNAKTAILMYLKNLSHADAKRLLEESGQSLRKALNE